MVLFSTPLLVMGFPGAVECCNYIAIYLKAGLYLSPEPQIQERTLCEVRERPMYSAREESLDRLELICTSKHGIVHYVIVRGELGVEHCQSNHTLTRTL